MTSTSRHIRSIAQEMTLTLVFDGPYTSWMDGVTHWNVTTLDEHGCEVGYYHLASADPDGMWPQIEHPDREHLGWPEGAEQPWSFYNNVDESWACPSEDAALYAALYETADRIDSDWYFPEECTVLVEEIDAAHAARMAS